jgi:SAM-dependent methyltransferase
MTKREKIAKPDTAPFSKDYFADTYGCDGLRRFGAHWWSVRMYASITNRWMHKIQGKRLLEIGCGHGFILGMLEKKYKTFGLDISAYAISQAHRFAPSSQCFVGDVEKEIPQPLRNHHFDFILARYVLEHLENPGDVLPCLRKLLRPGGIVFFSVPNTKSLGARLKKADWYARKDPTHVSLLPPEHWIDVTKQAGFDIVKEFSDGYWDIPYIRNVPTWLQAPVFMGPTVLACMTGRDLLPARFGENIMVIAQKPGSKGCER